MDWDAIQEELRESRADLGEDTVLVTPSSEEAFVVTSVEDDRIGIEFEETGEERSLWRSQFEILSDRLEEDPDGISIGDLPAGVEPYVSVMSLLPNYAVDETADAMRRDDSSEGSESPFLRPGWTARTAPERVRDDAILLSDALDRHDVSDPDSLPPEVLVNLYVLLSDVQRGSDRLRRAVGDVLLEYIGPSARLHGRYGTVHRTRRERRHLKPTDAVLEALDAEGVPHEWVIGIDREKLDVVISVTDVDEDDVYDVEEQVYVQKTQVEEGEKQSRLQGLEDRLDALETEDATELRDDIRELEERLETMLASG